MIPIRERGIVSIQDARKFSQGQRIKIFTADRLTCQVCNLGDAFQSVISEPQAHAINGDHSNWQNGMTTCEPCHIKIHQVAPLPHRDDPKFSQSIIICEQISREAAILGGISLLNDYKKQGVPISEIRNILMQRRY